MQYSFLPCIAFHSKHTTTKLRPANRGGANARKARGLLKRKPKLWIKTRRPDITFVSRKKPTLISGLSVKPVL